MATNVNNSKLNNLIIDLVKATPILFNGLGNSLENDSDWKRISNVLMDNGFHEMNASILKIKWKNLRDQYVRALRESRKSQKPVKFIYFSELSFLNPYVSHKKDTNEVCNVNQDNETIARNDEENSDRIQKCSEINYRNDPLTCNGDSDLNLNRSAAPQVKTVEIPSTEFQIHAQKYIKDKNKKEKFFKNFPIKQGIRKENDFQLTVEEVQKEVNKHHQQLTKRHRSENVPQYDQYAKRKKKNNEDDESSMNKTNRDLQNLIGILCNYYIKKTSC